MDAAGNPFKEFCPEKVPSSAILIDPPSRHATEMLFTGLWTTLRLLSSAGFCDRGKAAQHKLNFTKGGGVTTPTVETIVSSAAPFFRLFGSGASITLTLRISKKN